MFTRCLVLTLALIVLSAGSLEVCARDVQADEFAIPRTCPARPEANTAVEDSVPVDMLEKIADAHASEVWGPQVARGKPFPLADRSGDLFGYVFPYAIESERFPTDREIFDEIAGMRSRHHGASRETTEMPPEFYSELVRFGESFGTIYVSARGTNFPVFRVSHFLHPYFVNGEAAQREASRRLGREETRLERIYYIGSNEQYLEFESGGSRELVDANWIERPIDRTALDTEVEPPDPAINKEIEESWARVTSPSFATRHVDRAFPGPPAEVKVGEHDPDRAAWEIIPDVAPLGLPPSDISTTHTVKKIAYWELIPRVDHTPSHWCVIASKAMVLGFYDNFVRGKGTLVGFGRLIDYWYEYSPGGYNLPNIIDEFHGKDVWKINNYSCSWVETEAESSNGYAWSKLKAEVDAGRPCFWSNSGHTVAAFGYRIDSQGDKWAIAYDPPNPSVPTYVNEYRHANCVGIGAVIPSGGSGGEHLIITSPDGGETCHTSIPSEINWYVWGKNTRKTTLSVSEDGGKNWKILAADVPTKSEWNTFSWIPGPASNKVRVRIQGYTQQGQYIAGDGSQNNISVIPPPNPKGWKQIWGPTGMALAAYNPEKGSTDIYATKLNGGDIYRYDGQPQSWTKIGNPGKSFAADDFGRLYGLAPDGGSVHMYTGQPMDWIEIGGPAGQIYAGGETVFATDPGSGDLWRYDGKPHSWTRIGGPGKSFAIDGHGRPYAISPNGTSVWRYDGEPMQWTQIGGPASHIYAGGSAVYATNPQTGELYFYDGRTAPWTLIGGSGKMFAVDGLGRIFGLAPDVKSVSRYDGTYADPWEWTQVGGPAKKIFAGGHGKLLGLDPATNNLWMCE